MFFFSTTKNYNQGVDPSNLGPTLPREEILDRMDAHTKDCSACGKAHRGALVTHFFVFLVRPQSKVRWFLPIITGKEEEGRFRSDFVFFARVKRQSMSKLSICALPFPDGSYPGQPVVVPPCPAPPSGWYYNSLLLYPLSFRLKPHELESCWCPPQCMLESRERRAGPFAGSQCHVHCFPLPHAYLRVRGFASKSVGQSEAGSIRWCSAAARGRRGLSARNMGSRTFRWGSNKRG